METHKSWQRGRSWRFHSEGRGSTQHGRHSAPYENNIQLNNSPPLGPLLQTLSEANFVTADQAQSSSGEKVEIVHCAYVASFNWLDRNEPTVLIPGAPPAWTPLNKPRRLEEDKGDYFRDPNAARFPTNPQEPAVRSLLMEHEDLETQKIDLFACSSTVGNLLRFVRGVKQPFRFFVEAVGNTVFFIRHENSPTQLIEGVRGFGHTFPEAYTTWDADVKGSASHQRLLRYDLAGLDCILRHECDGYLPSKVPEGSSATTTFREQQISERQTDLSSLLDLMNVNSSLAGKEIQSGPLQIKRAGRKIPQEAIFDLKTRGGWRKDLNVLEDELPRYWVAQISNFILARHKNGVFNDINVQEIRPDVQKWQGANQKIIRRLIWLLQEIIAAVKLRQDRKLEVCAKGPEALELREQDTNEHNVLSEELKSRWMDNVSCKDEQSKSESDDKSVGNEAFPAEGSDISRDGGRFGFDSDEESEKDFTACSADDCGYCGHCSY